MKNLSEKAKDLLSIILILIIMFFIWYLYWNLNDRTSIKQQFGKNDQKYNFLSPLLNCPESKYIQDSRSINIQDNLQAFIDSKTRNSWVNHISVYFRDLNNGYRFWLNEKEVFTPASLTKVPTLMAVLKKSETQKDFLYQNVNYSLPKIDYNVHYKPRSQIESNKVYTIEQLLTHMIKYSDNNATQILWNILGWNWFFDIYKELAINANEFNKIQVVDYASFFRILFNASYLNKDNSEFALNLLSQVDFKNWLVAGVPENIKIAHKFWEYSLDWGLKQIHDCGIIYYPSRPYLLCIMTRWIDYHELEWVISQTSKLIFTEVNNVYKEIK